GPNPSSRLGRSNPHRVTRLTRANRHLRTSLVHHELSSIILRHTQLLVRFPIELTQSRLELTQTRDVDRLTSPCHASPPSPVTVPAGHESRDTPTSRHTLR